MKKKLLSMVTVLFLALVIVFTSTSNAYAAGLSSSQKSKIKSLVSNTLPLTMCTNMSIKKGNKKSFDFSKASDRKKVLYGLYGETSAKDLFGVSMKPVTDDTGKYYGKYYADTGDAYFMFKNFKYNSIGNNSYRVTANFNYKLESKSGSIGKVTFRVKKNSDSKYGFILKKMNVKRTSDVNPWG